MSWQPEIDELRRRERLALAMGGPEKIQRQRDAGRLTVRERIDLLVDPGSFHETGAISGRACSHSTPMTLTHSDRTTSTVPRPCMVGHRSAPRQFAVSSPAQAINSCIKSPRPADS